MIRCQPCLVNFYLPADTYRFRVDIYGHQYFSDENALTIVPTNTTSSITVPVFGAVIVTVADSDHEPVPDLAVYAYLGQDEYVGISGSTDIFGKTTLMLPEGTYRFKTDQYGIEFWSNATANCNTPTECTTASITVIGRDYLANDQTINYTYDDLNRLTAADYDIGLYYHYTYDAVGNRLSQETAYNNTPVTTNYAYDNANRISTVNSQAYTWDANGNLTNDGQYTYSYDTANRLTQLVGNGVTTNYKYNDLGDRLQYSNSQGNLRNYSLDINGELSQVIQDGIASYVYGVDLLGFEEWRNYYDYQKDVLGSIRQMMATDPTGQDIRISATTTYDPYGNVILNTWNTNNIGYTGEFQDEDINDLVFLRARHYAPRTGTFLSRDSWDGDANQPMSYNKWMYTYGNPVNYVDPSGNKPTMDNQACDYSDPSANLDIVESNLVVDKSKWLNTYTSSAMAVQCWGMNKDTLFPNDTKGPSQISDSQIVTAYGAKIGQNDHGLRCFIMKSAINNVNEDYDTCNCFTPKEINANPNFYENYELEPVLDPNDWHDAFILMKRRIKLTTDYCESLGCGETDKFLFAAMAQNGPGFTAKDVRLLKNKENWTTQVRINWKLYFVGRAYKDTKEQIVRFLKAVNGFKGRNWYVPPLSHDDINDLLSWDPSSVKDHPVEK